MSARLGGGNAEVVVALLKVLGPIGAQWCDLKRPLAAAGAIAALRHLSETGGIPTAPEKLLSLCAQDAPAGQRRFAHPYNSALNRSLSYGLARMRVAAHQGAAAVEPLTLETAVLLAPFYEANAGGLVGALAPAVKEPRIQILIQESAAGKFGNETTAAQELLAKSGIEEKAPVTLKEEPKTPPSLDDALGL